MFIRGYPGDHHHKRVPRHRSVPRHAEMPSHPSYSLAPAVVAARVPCAHFAHRSSGVTYLGSDCRSGESGPRSAVARPARPLCPVTSGAHWWLRAPRPTPLKLSTHVRAGAPPMGVGQRYSRRTSAAHGTYQPCGNERSQPAGARSSVGRGIHRGT